MFHIGIIACVMLLVQSVAQAQVTPGPVQEFGDWTFQVLTDEIKDVEHYRASTKSTKGRSGILSVLCNSEIRRPYTSYTTGMFMGIDLNETTVTYRVDGQPPVRERWKMSDDVVMTFGRDRKLGLTLPTKMMDGRQLFIRAFSYDSDVAQHKFSLNGASEAIGIVFERCGMSVPAKMNSPVVRPNNAPSNSGGEPVAQTQSSSADIYQWEQIKDSTDPALFDAFLFLFPKSEMAPLARKRLGELR